MQQSLFPDNAYRHDSGGDPAAIPDLTFEQFQVRRADCADCPARARGLTRTRAPCFIYTVQNSCNPKKGGGVP